MPPRAGLKKGRPMTYSAPGAFPVFALFALFATPAGAQSTMSAAQCDAMMLAGTQTYPAAAVAACSSYFQALADGAIAPGAFATTPLLINAPTSGTGG